MHQGEFVGYGIGDRKIFTVDGGVAEFATDATRDDLKSAIMYMVMVIDKLSKRNAGKDILKDVAQLQCAAPSRLGECGHCIVCAAKRYIEEHPETVRANAADAG